jgi:hypothetical protein
MHLATTPAERVLVLVSWVAVKHLQPLARQLPMGTRAPGVYEQYQGVGLQVEVDPQFNAHVLIELIMYDDLHNGSAETSNRLATINICAICVVVDVEGTADQNISF